SGRAVDVLVDTLQMCHVLEFRDRIERMPFTLDVTDLLLSKLQIVEINEKDVQDVLYLLAAYPVAEGDVPGTIGLDRIRAIVADDWGWWRTLTGTVDHAHELAGGEHPELVTAGARHDVLSGLRRIRGAGEKVQKTRRGKGCGRTGGAQALVPEAGGRGARVMATGRFQQRQQFVLESSQPAATVAAAPTC